MTDGQCRTEVEKLIENHTERYSASKEVARASLIKEGIYTKKGRLTVKYCGQEKKPKG